MKALYAIKDRAEQSNQNRVLIDMRETEPPQRDFERYLAGKAFSSVLRPPLRVAVLYAAENIDKFAENTAVNRGALLRVTSDLDEAIKWLREE